MPYCECTRKNLFLIFHAFKNFDSSESGIGFPLFAKKFISRKTEQCEAEGAERGTDGRNEEEREDDGMEKKRIGKEREREDGDGRGRGGECAE